MTQQSITLGTVDNDRTGEGLREGGVKIQANFTELYAGAASVLAQSNTSTAQLSTIKSDYCDPRDFIGWDPTGASGISTILNSAVSQAITAKVQLRVPTGTYLLDAPINVTPAAASGGLALDMIGVGSKGWNRDATFPNNRSGVMFQATFADRPAFYNSIGAKNLTLANFAIVGLCTSTLFQEPNNVKANYVVNGCRDSRYSPYCAIGLDMFNNTVPPDGGYPGMSATYASGSGGSSPPTFENISVAGFVVGMAFGCSGAGGQADTMMLTRPYIAQCDTAIAIGQAQSKSCNIIGGQIISNRQGFDGLAYGQQQGCPFNLYGVALQYLHRIFSFSAAFGPFAMQNCYMESVRSWGNYGTAFSTSRGHMHISKMQAQFHAAAGPLPPITLETYGPASIADINFGQDTAAATTPAWNIANDLGTPVTIDTCTFATGSSTGIPTIIGQTDTGCSVSLRNCISHGSGSVQPLSDDSTQDVTKFALSNRFAGPLRATRYANGVAEVFYQSANTTGLAATATSGAAFTTRAVTFTGALTLGATQATVSGSFTDPSGWYDTLFSNGDTKRVLFANGAGTVAKWGADGLSSSATAAVTVQRVALTFTASDITLWQLGDMILWKMLAQGGSTQQRFVPGWKVTGIAGSVVTCQALFEVNEYDTVANNSANMSIIQPQWAPTTALTCTTDGTTANITAVAPITILKNGDWVSGVGLAANSRVVAGGGTASVTLNKATTAAASGVNLFFGRFMTPVTTATW